MELALKVKFYVDFPALSYTSMVRNADQGSDIRTHFSVASLTSFLKNRNTLLERAFPTKPCA